MAPKSVSLACMPWHMLESPSIQLGTLHALLQRSGIPCRSHSLHLGFQLFVEERGAEGGRFGIDDYAEVGTRWMNVGAGEWVFAAPGASGDPKARDERFERHCRGSGMSAALLRKLRRLRAIVPAFLARCADEVLAAEPAVVGFPAVYSQTLPSIALARVLKARAPSLRIVLGGASGEGPMGPALLRAFEAVDVVVRGEAEGVFPELAASLCAGAPPPRLPGVCFREEGRIVEVPRGPGPRVAMDDVPVPEYGEYFERLSGSALAPRILPQIPFETSRGCWWGARSHCTFCGLNGTEMAFRSKSPGRVLAEVRTLARRHGALDFTCTDNILDMRYFDTLLPSLAGSGHDPRFFFEVKANLTEARVRALRAAGALAIQPGIESLSTPTLKLMRKGVTALQNVRLLKWCATQGIHVIWNLLYGFPGESPEEYARMAERVPSLVHLEPPTLSALMVYRFSPYHERPEEHGLRLGAPLPWYRLLVEADEACLRDLAQAFEFAYADGRDPERYVGPLRERVEEWRRDWPRNRGALTYRRGPGFLLIADSRTTTPAPARYTFGEEEAAAYLTCDVGATFDAIANELRQVPGPPVTEDRLRAMLREFLDAGLIYEEDGRYLSLALPNAA